MDAAASKDKQHRSLACRQVVAVVHVPTLISILVKERKEGRKRKGKKEGNKEEGMTWWKGEVRGARTSVLKRRTGLQAWCRKQRAAIGPAGVPVSWPSL